MTTRRLIEDNGGTRLWRVFDGDQEVGTDVETILTPEQVNERTIRGRVAALLAASVAYLALPNPPGPTAAQTTAQVQRNTRLTIALAKLALGQLNTTEGT
jgi:hypothetical protein